ncbi:MAG: energy-coupling factor ABC transporter ATP-binding protein [Candidatus Limnocylindria bacterium]
MTELAVEELVHVYAEGGVRALDGVSVRIAAGERVALVGQNGSGKTTLVRHLNGLLRPTQGRVLVDGADARDLTVAQLARRVGLVFQDPDRQIFAGSVRSEVEFGPRNVGLSWAELRAAVGDALEATGLDGEERTNPYDLGGSRRKLLALASVLAMRTPVLVLDEPTTGQDLRGVDRVRTVIERAAAAGRTVIAISHDMRFVAEAFERVIVLRAGRILLDGAPTEVFSADAWEALRSTYLEPPLAAVVGARLDLGSTPTDESLIAALRG